VVVKALLQHLHGTFPISRVSVEHCLPARPIRLVLVSPELLKPEATQAILLERSGPLPQPKANTKPGDYLVSAVVRKSPSPLLLTPCFPITSFSTPTGNFTNNHENCIVGEILIFSTFGDRFRIARAERIMLNLEFGGSLFSVENNG
jgi:hypothetical protein